MTWNSTLRKRLHTTEAWGEVVSDSNTHCLSGKNVLSSYLPMEAFWLLKGQKFQSAMSLEILQVHVTSPVFSLSSKYIEEYICNVYTGSNEIINA